MSILSLRKGFTLQESTSQLPVVTLLSSQRTDMAIRTSWKILKMMLVESWDQLCYHLGEIHFALLLHNFCISMGVLIPNCWNWICCHFSPFQIDEIKLLLFFAFPDWNRDCIFQLMKFPDSSEKSEIFWFQTVNGFKEMCLSATTAHDEAVEGIMTATRKKLAFKWDPSWLSHAQDQLSNRLRRYGANPKPRY